MCWMVRSVIKFDHKTKGKCHRSQSDLIVQGDERKQNLQPATEVLYCPNDSQHPLLGMAFQVRKLKGSPEEPA